MKICVPAKAEGLSADMDSRFGRCAYFVFVDSQTGEVKSMKNPSANADRGAGVSAAQLVLDEGAQVVVSENLGGHAKEVLQESDIKIIELSAEKVSEAIELAKQKLGL